MSGSKTGGKAAAMTNKRLYGDDFYHKIGSKGGKKHGDEYTKEGGKAKGFAANPNRAAEAGRKGGLISRRGKSEKTQG